MASPRQYAANRRNAQRSTGPRTRAGKTRSRRNALSHGLAIPAASLPEFAPDLAALTQALAGELAHHPDVRAAAARVAEATLEALRARRARTILLECLLADQPAAQAAAEAIAPAPPRYSRHAHIRAILDGTEEQYLDAVLAPRTRQAEHRRGKGQPVGDWNALHKLDRYERRALSRRHAAIQTFDAACAAARHLASPQKSPSPDGPATLSDG